MRSIRCEERETDDGEVEGEGRKLTKNLHRLSQLHDFVPGVIVHIMLWL
jgi:hypothetical protein